MRKLKLFFLFLIPLVSSAQNWQPFPLNQNSYFKKKGWTTPVVKMDRMDSISVHGNDHHFYFKQNLEVRGLDSCPLDLNHLVFESTFKESRPIDSLVQHFDTLFFHYHGKAFPFIPQAQAGQSWTVILHGKPFTIHCLKTAPESFCGITDSVKTFIFKDDKQVVINNASIRLSKHYGFVEYFHFPEVTQFSINPSILIGLRQESGQTYGYKPLGFEDYIHPINGSILMWEWANDPSSPLLEKWKEYYRDSITSVTSTADSIGYTYNRTTLDKNKVLKYQNGLVIKYYRRDIENFLNTPAHWIVNAQLTSDHQKAVWEHRYAELTEDSDTITSHTFSNSHTFIVPENCSLFFAYDLAHDFKINTKFGIISQCDYGYGGSACTKLIGSKINGNTEGNIHLSSEAIVLVKRELKIFPNPAKDIIRIENLPTANCEYRITNSNGQLIENGYLSGDKLDISQLANGLYFLEITMDNEVFHGKFLSFR